jgi:hypothetical protein
MLCLTAAPVLAQQPQSTIAGAPDTTAFRRLTLPTPNEFRTGSGGPGRRYWQQRADYVIRATLDTVSRTVRGTERISYTNNSPDTLRYLWLQLDQNLFTRESRGAAIFDRGARFGTAGAEGGFRLSKVAGPGHAPGGKGTSG